MDWNSGGLSPNGQRNQQKTHFGRVEDSNCGSCRYKHVLSDTSTKGTFCPRDLGSIQGTAFGMWEACLIIGQNALFSNWWMNEGGQSSTGQGGTSFAPHLSLTPLQLIDFVITTHPAHNELLEIAKKDGKPIYTVLEERLHEMKRGAGVTSLTRLTRDIHFYPDLHGMSNVVLLPSVYGSLDR